MTWWRSMDGTKSLDEGHAAGGGSVVWARWISSTRFQWTEAKIIEDGRMGSGRGGGFRVSYCLDSVSALPFSDPG